MVTYPKEYHDGPQTDTFSSSKDVIRRPAIPDDIISVYRAVISRHTGYAIPDTTPYQYRSMHTTPYRTPSSDAISEDIRVIYWDKARVVRGERLFAR